MEDKVVDQPVRLLQFTDPHLGELPDSQLLGVNTDHSLCQLRELALARHGRADYLLATGDISNDGSLLSYQRFRQLTEPLAAQHCWLPGNHDDVQVMATSLGGGLNKLIELQHWRIVLLNSAVPGEVGGALAELELQWLADVLAANDERHVLVCLHHHPVACGSAWLDRQQVANADQLFALLEQHSRVRALLWGHIHQHVDEYRQGMRLLATPSCCIQFAVNSDDFKLDEQQPGYRWLELYADGRLETGIERLPAGTVAADLSNSSGY
jgi:Icc protein